MNDKLTSRRRFLKATGLAIAAPYVITSAALGAEGRPPASERILMGTIGTGGQGTGDMGGFLGFPEVQMVAVCDPVPDHRENAKQRVDQHYNKQDCKAYNDFRQLLARDDIDAVLIGTPDHWHAIITIAACQHGKDVYCEKPECLTVREGRAMVDAVRRYERVFSGGSQRVLGDYGDWPRLVRGGALGEIKECWVSCGGPSGECYLPPQPIPPGLDWDMWLGPAPWRPFHETLIHGGFRNYRDYSGGGMTDWGAHHFDIAQWGLGMDGSGPVEITPPNGADVQALTYRYANGVIMYHKGYEKSQKAGVTFVGTEGVVMVNRSYLETDPVGLKDAPIGSDDVKLYQSPGHQRDWLAAIRTRTKPICDVEVGHRSASVCHIGNIAYQLGRTLHWDPVREEFANDPEANQLMQRPMRAPWRLA